MNAGRSEAHGRGDAARVGEYTGSAVAVRIWDLPTRLFHWALVACIAGSIVSVNIGGNAVGWHFRFGYAILTLLLFRVAWGLIGPRYARFSSFVPSVPAALRYLRGEHAPSPGHSPAGSLSVYAMLVALAVQVVTGLFAYDEIMWEGPLRGLVSNATGDRMTAVHMANRFVVIALIVLHVASIAWYTWRRRQSLVRPMLVGDRVYETGTKLPRPAADGARVRARAFALLAGCAAGVWAIVTRLGG